jgi:hypothetical protein
VLPKVGSPLKAEIFVERESAQPVASPLATKKGVQYRDRDGRVRVEEPSNVGDTIQLIDMRAGHMIILLPYIKRAVRFRFPPGEPGVSFTSGTIAALGSGSKTLSSQVLGSRVIEGIEFDGERTTATLVANPALVAREERWYSQALGLIGLMVTSGPERRTTARIQGIVREDPAPSLFQVPEGYEVQDVPSQVVPGAIP